jgi:hypothetical protein
VGVNHYQTAKAAIEASRAVNPGGHIILVAKNTDPDPIGGAGYKEALNLYMKHGRKAFMKLISAPGWNLIQEQWQVQMWCKVFEVIGEDDHLTYCSLDIPLRAYEQLPGKAGMALLSKTALSSTPEQQIMSKMIQKALADAMSNYVTSPSILCLKDGPYGIPECT